MVDVTSDDEMDDIFDSKIYLNKYELKVKKGAWAK
jgi:hypothetical protein